MKNYFEKAMILMACSQMAFSGVPFKYYKDMLEYAKED